MNKPTKDALENYRELVNKRLDFLLKSDVECEYLDKLFESMRYSIFAGGKRLRPVFCILAYKIFSEDLNRVIDFACALEIIHTYSLIHDDLPCMDNDDYRRGKLTNHKVFGYPQALLAGDALLNISFEIMAASAKENSKTIEDYNKYINAISEISRASGVNGMIGGQFADIRFTGSKLNEDIINFIHENKTAAMIEASLVSGAIIGGADKYQLEDIRLFGKNIGIAFQIQDDILDVYGTQEEIGKPVGSDDKNNKVTYVTLFGLDESKKIVSNLISDGIKKISRINNSDMLIDIANSLIDRRN